MEVSDQKLREISRRILISRMRVLVNNGFYGLLLMHMKVSLGDAYDTAWTDCNERIWFHPSFVDQLSDSELDYVLMHEILHAALQHVSRIGSYDTELFNWAADIVVNSNIYHSNLDSEDSIRIENFGGVQLHKTPDGSEGWEHSVEEVYRMLLNSCKGEKGDGKSKYNGWDHHVEQDSSKAEDMDTRYKWQGYMRQACEVISVRDPKKARGLLPAFAERYLQELKKPQVDWRQYLVEFIQDEVNDYSFTPPDRRMGDSPFFLPDFNERDEKPGKILFAIDTSGSMSDDEITTCFSEIVGAIEQFNGKLEGWLCFFDAKMTEPVEFSEVDDLLAIRPVGGGGTSFDIIFDYLEHIDEDDFPNSIVILTDGGAPFPDKRRTKGVPVLWIIDNEDVAVPWGKVARISVD